jgi:hypothetical protein
MFVHYALLLPIDVKEIGVSVAFYVFSLFLRSITSLQDLILSDILRSTPSLPVCSLAAVRRCVIYLSFVGTYFSHSHGTYLQPNHGDCEPN